ncbi:MAG: hypothetical protein Q7U75_12025, partial [Desulfobacterales bacterium]|nr:hypothetical protein [Desulfobacterales bacterium]
NDAGGSVTFLSAPANGSVVLLERDMDYSRTVDYQDSGTFFSTNANADSDRHTMAEQQLQIRIDRKIGFAPGFDQGGELELSLTPAQRASSVISFDSNGDIGITALPMISEPALAGKALNIPRVLADETTYELRTPAQVRNDIGADSATNLITGTLPNGRLSGAYTGVTGIGASGAPTTVTGSTVTLAGTTKVAMTGTGGAVLPSGTTGQRGADAGTIRFNSTSSKLEYTNDGASYLDIGSVTESTAPEYTASNGLYINSQAIAANVTVPAGHSAMSTGPMTLASGITVTLEAGSRWAVL